VTLESWLRDRTPAPPRRLAERISEVLGGRAVRPATEAHEQCVDAAVELLRDLLARPPGRESALDLLTVDALVTYAFEASASEPAKLHARAVSAMSRLSLVPQ
jgi:hypothetical protein